MVSIEGRKICKGAIKVYGPESQELHLIEELAELIVAIRHFHRNRTGLAPVLEEVADVYIMLEQFKIIYNVTDKQMASATRKKLRRLRTKLDI